MKNHALAKNTARKQNARNRAAAEAIAGPVPPGKAAVHIYRGNMLYGFAISQKIFIDGEYKCKVTRGSSHTVFVDAPGRHDIVAKFPFNTASLQVDTEVGKKYYISVAIGANQKWDLFLMEGEVEAAIDSAPKSVAWEVIKYIIIVALGVLIQLFAGAGAVVVAAMVALLIGWTAVKKRRSL